MLRGVQSVARQHNLAIDTGTYTKVTLHNSDVNGSYDEPDNQHLPRRRNHGGAAANVDMNPLVAGRGRLAQDGDEDAWYPPGHELHDPKLWKPEYLTQLEPGHTLTGDCQPRSTATDYFAYAKIVRPTIVHWE